MTERCIMYIDGYNFYYAVKRHPTSTPIHLAWCDFALLAKQFMIGEGAALAAIKYFTAPVGRHGASGGPVGSEAARQNVWLAAVATIPGLEIVEGYHTGPANDPRGRKEKETDVHIAVSLVADAARNRYDRAILVTGDRDQRPAVRAVAEEFGKRIDVWITPNQDVGLWKAAEGYSGVRVRSITVPMLRKSRLSDRIEVGGRTIETPKVWRAP